MGNAIKFVKYHRLAGITGHEPKPAIQFIPEWFKRIPRFVNGDKSYKITKEGGQNATVKLCNPFLDSMSAGYMVTLEHDIQVTQVEGGADFAWKFGDRLIDLHSIEQTSKQAIPAGYHETPYKFNTKFAIEAPDGYSLLFVHPLNRAELPFYTFSGIVDADSYQRPVNLPFLIREDFEGVLEAGTPIAQIIPIKRESWMSEVVEFDEDKALQRDANFFSKMIRNYKNVHWHKKDYR
jgi:hypothetical protein